MADHAPGASVFDPEASVVDLTVSHHAGVTEASREQAASCSARDGDPGVLHSFAVSPLVGVRTSTPA